MRYPRYLFVFLVTIFFSFPLFAQQGLNVAHTEASGSGGSASGTVGQLFYTTLDECGGRMQPGVLQPEFSLLTRESKLEATDTSDAYVTISWSLLEECFKNVDNRCMPYPDGVLVELMAEGERIYSDIVFNANGLLTDSYRHFIGPDSTVEYTLNLFIRGSGQMACTSISSTGSTLPFQIPTGLTASQGTDPGRVALSWTNNSQLSSSFLVYRIFNDDSTLVAAVPGTETVDTVFNFVDAFTPGSTSNLINGQAYDYCLVTFNDQLDQALPEVVCDMGSTLDAGLSAAVEDDRIVSLTWNALEDYSSGLRIRRDGELLAELDSTAVAYVDNNPTFGRVSVYALELLNRSNQVSSRDTTSVNLPAIGTISGFVRTRFNVGIAEVPVNYSVRIDSDTLTATTTTDYRGFYQFEDVFFDRRSIFNVRPSELVQTDPITGTTTTVFTFGTQSLRDTLSNEDPASRMLNFTAQEIYPVSQEASISVDTVFTQTGIDELSFFWEYTASDDLEDTLHFQLYREDQLIAITDDQVPLPLQLVDRSGSAGYNYKYRLVAYGFKEDSLVTDSRVLFDTMPETEPPYNLIGDIEYDSNSDGVMTLTWNHDSENFDGFRLYRDNALLVVLDTASRFFTDYFAEPGATYNYALTAFRFPAQASDPNEILESDQVESGPLTIPDLPDIQSLSAVPLPNRNAIELSWSLPDSPLSYDNLSGFLVSRNGVPVKQISKDGQDYTYVDYQGIPGINTTYTVEPVLSTPDTTYFGAPEMEAVDYPSIAMPELGPITPSEPGVLRVELDGNYTQTYSNFDVFVLAANNIPFDTLRPFESETYLTPNATAGLTGVDIQLRACRQVMDNFFCSDADQSTENIAGQSGVPIDSLTHFRASKEIPMHIGLKWKFPDYIFATFSIFRDGVLLDTLPHTARNYYDYEATPGERHLYTIQAEYEGVKSPVYASTGIRRGTDYLHGQMLANQYTSDRNGVAVNLRDEGSGALLLRTFTDSSGYFRFTDLHDQVGSGVWEVEVDDLGGGHQLTDNTQAPIGPNFRVVLFRDAFTPAANPPLPLQDSIARVASFQLSPFPQEQGVVASWGFSEGAYDGTVLQRGLSEIATLEAGGRTFFLDTTGTSGTDYPYLSGPYVLEGGENLPEAEQRSILLNEIFPVLPPVECLSALPNLNYLDNSITLQWSHYNGKVDYYAITRNGLPLAQALPSDSLFYVDIQGKPDQTYIYEVRAVRVENTGLTVSDPRRVQIVFPEVARPQPLIAEVWPDSNGVQLEWGYNGEAVTGFRIFRNDIPLVDLPAGDRKYVDYNGIPFSDVEYSIVALKELEGMLFQSRATSTEALYPAVVPPYASATAVVDSLGVVKVSFKYRARAVNRFEISRVNGGNREHLGFLPYSFNGQEQSFTFTDQTGTPGISYTYEIRARKPLDGIVYESAAAPGSPQVFPHPPGVRDFDGSKLFSNWVDLSWGQNLDANVDGYRIIRDTIANGVFQSPLDTFFVFNPGKRTYRNLFFPFPKLPSGSLEYKISAYRLVNGQYYFSNESITTGKLSNPGGPTELVQIVASKGTFPNRTRISWIYGGNLANVERFFIYRDEEQIANLPPDEDFYNDSDGVPGRPYVYTVRAVVSGEEDEGLQDIGFIRGSGQLEGEVVSLQGSAPIEGAKLVARGIVDGEAYTYETSTNNNGQFILSGLYVGEDVADYVLSVSFEDHGFLDNDKPYILSPQNSTRSNIVFFDTTAYVAVGEVFYANTNCGIDSITLRAKHFLNDGTIVEESTTTDQDGAYSLVLNPYLSGLERIVVEIDSVFVRNAGTGEETRILHRFGNPAREVEMPVPQLSTFNFEDRLTYDVEIAVRNVCGFAASSNARFDIEVSTRDGCFKRVERTELNGILSIGLPPIDGLVARVTGAAPLSLENNLIVNYLEYRPTGLDLEQLHIENSGFNDEGDFVQNLPDTLVERVLVYHKPATITLANEFGMRPGCDPDQPRIIEQGQSYTLRFDVTELHQGIVCDVTEGYIIINNAAAENNTRDTLFYIPETGQFESHQFTAGEPNLVTPFRKGINLQYLSDIGDLLAERTIPVVVEGVAPLPGSDIIVDPKDEEGQLKFPVFILRDPPGDGSYSYIEEGESVTKSIQVFANQQIRGSLFAEFQTTVGGVIGTFLEVDSGLGGEFGQESENSVTFTLKQSIETSSTSDFVGPEADVLVGIGVSTQYGITEIVEFDEATCSFRKRQQIDIAPEGIKTDWLYTVGQIRQLINERTNDIEQVEAGTKTIVIGGEELTPEEAIARLELERQNWESVLRYHEVQTVPYFQLCAEDYSSPAYAERVSADRIQAAEEARSAFCSTIGVEVGDTTTTAPEVQEIIFTSSLQEAYEDASLAVSYYLDSLSLSPLEVEGLLQGILDENAPLIEVENTTFSAGVTINKSESAVRTSSNTIKQRGFWDLALKGGFFAENENLVGLGLFSLVFKTETKIGVGVELDFDWGTNRFDENTQEYTVGYVLSDDDPGDQFSVTAIRPRHSGHTPYFQLLGGRSSCPPEVGAIQRDRFDISLYDPETQSTFDFQELRALNPNQPATFYVQLTNLNPFGEQRDLFVYHEAESNENGAALRLNGGLLGGGNQSGQTLTFINPNQPVILPLTLTRSLNNYQFDSIYVVLRPSCTDGDLFLLGERDTVTISAFFETPCSDISIASPGNDWLITRRNPFQADSREAIVVEVGDYDSENPNLEEIYLEYRRIGEGDGWEIIPFTELEPRYIVIQDSLIQYDMENFGPGESPRFFFTWDITELYQKYPDGIYEVRAVAACGTDGVVQSNIIRGQIRRQTGEAFALFEPSDLVWQTGDEISIKVNRELDCATLDEASFLVVNELTQDTVPGTFGCDPTENKLVFQPLAPSTLFETLEPFDDQLLTIKVSGLRDEFGNAFPLLRDAQGIVQETLDANGNTVPARDTFEWDFRVIARDILVQDTFLETTIYQDSNGTLSTILFNTNEAAGATIDFSIPELATLPWLEATPDAGIITTSDGRPVRFDIDGSLLPVGDTTVVLSFVSGSDLNNAGVDNIRLKVNVLARPPYWEVDPSQYSNSMQVVVNYQYTQPPGNNPSRDTMDIISAWIGNEIRGVARIASTQTGQYAAFMLVYGNPEDIGKPLEFRAWDADPGEEYNAYPIDSLFFDETMLVGSFSDPELLFVDRDRDRARYIPVNGEGDGGGGLTWLSFNSQETDMAVGEQLRELKFLQNGDIIKTEETSAGYVEGVGWISTNGLDSIDVEEGYILFLGNLDDTIRVTGRDATFGPIILEQGWNLIGYPLQDTVGINDAFTLLNVEDGDRMQTVPQDPAALSLPPNMIAEYNETLMQWLFAPGMEVMRPNFAYQVFVGNPAATMLYNGYEVPLSPEPVSDGFGYNPSVFTPADPSTWSIDPSVYPTSMVVTSTLQFDGEMSLDEGDKVAAYVNGECRGVAPVSYVQALDAYRAPLFVYGTQAGETVEFLMYDASTDRVHLAAQQLSFQPNGIEGSFVEPFVFEAQSMSATYTQSSTYCAADANGTLDVTIVSGLQPPYSYEWNTGAQTAALEGLAAGDYTVTITGANGLSFTDTVTLENLEVEIPAPEVEWSADNPVCRGSDVVLYAQAPNQEASVRWETADGLLLQESPALMIEGIQSAYTAYAKTVYRGCESEPLEASVQVYQPDASFTVDPATEVTTETEVQFSPAEATGAFIWNFGDGQTSSLVNPAHQYELPGHYQAILSRTDLAGCTGQGLYDLWVNAATQVLELPEGELRLQATPNPFGQYIDIHLQLPDGGQYTLELLSISGQVLERRQEVWQAGEQTIRLLPDLADGTYLIRLESGKGHQLALPVVKQTPRP